MFVVHMKYRYGKSHRVGETFTKIDDLPDDATLMYSHDNGKQIYGRKDEWEWEWGRFFTHNDRYLTEDECHEISIQAWSGWYSHTANPTAEQTALQKMLWDL